MLPTFWARPIYPRVIFEDGVVLIVIEPTTASALKVDILGIVVNADCKPVAVGKYPWTILANYTSRKERRFVIPLEVLPSQVVFPKRFMFDVTCTNASGALKPPDELEKRSLYHAKPLCLSPVCGLNRLVR
jgi:hypothetical protein